MRGSLQQQRKGYWVLKIYVGRDAETGKRLYRTLAAGRTKREAEAFQTRIMAEMDAGAFVANRTTTVADAVTAHLEQATLDPGTAHRYEQLYRLHIAPACGSVPLVRLAPEHIEAMQRRMRDQGRSDATIHHAHALLKAALQSAMRKGQVMRNVASLVTMPKLRKRDLDIPEDDVLHQLLVALNSRRLYPAYYLCLLLGLRRGEVFGLKWSDVDFERAQLIVRRVLQYTDKNQTRASLRLREKPKTKASYRTLPLTDSAIDLLRAWQRRQQQERDAWGSAYQDLDLVFSREDGSFASLHEYTRAFRDAAQAAGLKSRDWTAHALRHMRVSMALDAGADTRVVQRQVGHSSAGYMVDTYGRHIRAKAQQEEAERFDAVVSRLAPPSPR